MRFHVETRGRNYKKFLRVFITDILYSLQKQL
jgi:hypothetical protein